MSAVHLSGLLGGSNVGAGPIAARAAALTSRDNRTLGFIRSGSADASIRPMPWEMSGLYIAWDADTCELSLDLDVSGVTALYYTVAEDVLRFATTLPDLLSTVDARPLQVDPAGLVDVLLWGRLLPPNTPYAGIRAVPPGHTLRIVPGERGVRFTCAPSQRWWNVVADAFDTAVRKPNDMFGAAMEAVRTNEENSRHHSLSIRFAADEVSLRGGADLDASPLAADETFNELPWVASNIALPVADVEEGGVAALLRRMSADAVHFSCDLAAPVLNALATTGGRSATRRSMSDYRFMATRGLRARFSELAAARTAELYRPVRQLQRALGNSSRDEHALFQLLHVLPDRRMRLAALARALGHEINIECANPLRLASRLASISVGRPASEAPRAATFVRVATEPLWAGRSGANPYDSATSLYLMRGEFEEVSMSHYFRLTPWAVSQYWRRRATPGGPEIERRLCAILSMQYLLNHT